VGLGPMNASKRESGTLRSPPGNAELQLGLMAGK